MSLCPRCEFDLGEPPANANCPRCGVRVNARRRSLSGFSLPVAATASSPPSSPPRSSSTPPRREVDDDSWGVSDEVARSPAPPPTPPRSATSVFRAPTHAAPRAREEVPAQDEVGSATRVIGGSVVEEAIARRAELDAAAAVAPIAPPPPAGGAVAVGLPRRDAHVTGASTRATLVQASVRPDHGAGRSTLILGPDEALPQPEAPPATRGPVRATPLGVGAPPREGVEPMRSSKSTLVMSAPLDLTPPAPRGGSAERGASTLIMAAAPPPPTEPARTSTTLVMAAPPEAPAMARGVKSTLVMATSLEAPRESPAAPPARPPIAKPRLDLRAPTRGEVSPTEAPPHEAPLLETTPAQSPTLTTPTVEETARDTVDPLAQTMPVEDLVSSLDLIDDPTPLQPVVPASAVVPPRPPAIETARVEALVSPRAAALRPPRATPRASRRLQVVAAASVVVLLVAPWLAPMRAAERAVALLGGLIAAAVGAAPRSSNAPAALAVAVGAPLLGGWLLLTSDLPALGLGLTLAVLLVLPGALFHRGDRPESSRGAALVGIGLLLGVAWVLLPAAGALLRGGVPPTQPREYATVALLPWLLLGGMSLPRATAGASGAPFAAGVVLWSAALAMLRTAALAVPEPSQWRVVAVTGAVAGALTATLSAGVARALDADEA